jgi:transmembrane sensor
VAEPSIALRPDRQVLPDGSAAELNAGAEIAVQFTPEKRTVRLVRGEALFDVVEDADRPFVVAAGQIEIRAVGTAFAVRNAEDEIAVLVTKGQVAVQRADAGPRGSPAAPATVVQPIYLAAGRKMTIPLASTVAVPKATYVSPEELMEALAWRTRRVEFTSTPLREAVALFNRQQPGKRLVVGDDATASLKITGVFWTDDPEGFSRLLVFSLGLKADTSAEGRIVLRE